MPNELPADSNGWFQRHIIEALSDLKEGHRTMVDSQKEMHRENRRMIEDLASTISTHEEADQQMFTSVREEISDTKSDLASVKQDVAPLKKIIYGAVAIILVAFLSAWITGVIVSRQPVTVNPQGAK